MFIVMMEVCRTSMTFFVKYSEWLSKRLFLSKCVLCAWKFCICAVLLDCILSVLEHQYKYIIFILVMAVWWTKHSSIYFWFVIHVYGTAFSPFPHTPTPSFTLSGLSKLNCEVNEVWKSWLWAIYSFISICIHFILDCLQFFFFF